MTSKSNESSSKSSVEEILEQENLTPNQLRYFPKKTRVFYIGVAGMSRQSAEKYTKMTMENIKADTLHFENFYIPDHETNNIKIVVLG